jgi:hypothetical protein
MLAIHKGRLNSERRGNVARPKEDIAPEPGLELLIKKMSEEVMIKAWYPNIRATVICLLKKEL